MRAASCLVVALGGAILGGATALAADRGPVIVIPGRLGAPVIIDGVDASGAVVEGDFGLSSPHMVAPAIIAGPVATPDRIGPRGYYPAFGHQPAVGRYEIEPPPGRRLPAPAQGYHRSWESHSDPLPATLDPPVQSPPLLVTPEIFPQWRHGDRRP